MGKAQVDEKVTISRPHIKDRTKGREGSFLSFQQSKVVLCEFKATVISTASSGEPKIHNRGTLSQKTQKQKQGKEQKC